VTTARAAFHEAGFGPDEAAADEFRLAFDFAAQLINGEDGEDEPSSERWRRSRMTRSSTTSVAEPESMQTRPAVTCRFAGVVAVELEDSRRFP